jgi:hypothetical protein
MSTTFSKKETSVTKNCGMYFGVNSLQKDIAEVISRRMKALGNLNPNQVEKRSKGEISSAGIRKILKGETGIMVDSLLIIAKALDTSPIELLAEALKLSENNQPAVVDAKLSRVLGKLSVLPLDVFNILEVEVDALHLKFASESSNGPISESSSRTVRAKVGVEKVEGSGPVRNRAGNTGK